MMTSHDQGHRVGPMLADGRTIGDLVDLARREVSLRVLSDPEIYRWELQRIFARSWTFVGHDSEIPEPGDFVLRSIGEDKLIVTRTREGDVSVLVNVCTHRGVQLCRVDEGNCKTFKCPYHGWTFNGTGAMVGAPFEREVYGELDRASLGLRTASVEVRHGVILANLDRDPEPLDQFLGEEMGWYFDQLFGQTEMVAKGPPFRHLVNANWKVIVDQLGGDGYHFQTTHRAMSELGIINAPASDTQAWSVESLWVRLARANGFVCTDALGPLFASAGMERKQPLAGWLMVGLLFPSSNITTVPLPDTEALYPSIGGLVPHGPQQTETWQVQLVPKQATRETRSAITAGSSIGDMILPDDLENWESMSRGARGVISSEGTMKYNAAPRAANQPPAWAGPGEVYSGFHSDDSQWRFWVEWTDLMTTQSR